MAESLSESRLQTTVMELQAKLSGQVCRTERGKQRSSPSTVVGRKRFVHRRTSSQPTGSSHFKDSLHVMEPSGSTASSSSAEEQQARPRRHAN